jgi:hypothetical protein
MTIKKTAAQFVFDHLDEIEHKIAMGYYQTAILADLAEAGNEMTLATFRKSLARARSKKASKSSVYHPASNVDALQCLAMGRLTPDEIIQLEKVTTKGN